MKTYKLILLLDNKTIGEKYIDSSETLPTPKSMLEYNGKVFEVKQAIPSTYEKYTYFYHLLTLKQAQQLSKLDFIVTKLMVGVIQSDGLKKDDDHYLKRVKRCKEIARMIIDECSNE